MSCRCEKDYLCIECASRKSAEDALAAAQAQAAELRRALEEARGVMQECVADTVGTPTETFFMAQVRKIDAALAITPGEALERVRREARIAALEALGCTFEANGFVECLRAEGIEEGSWCRRCRALNAAKGGA